MRYMLIVKANEDSEAGRMPSTEELASMGAFNEELVNAGIMLAGEGLAESAKGVRIKSTKGQVEVIDGPFAEAKELIAGFWILDVKSLDEAVAWAKRCPALKGTFEIEIRKVHEAEDFGDSYTAELQAQEEALRAKISEQHS